MTKYNGIWIITALNLCYFSFLELFWTDPHAITGFLFSLSLGLSVYFFVLLFFSRFLFTKNNIHIIERGIILFFILVFTISAIGKYSWGSIPTPGILINSFKNKFSIIKVLPFNPLPLIVIYVLVIALILKAIRKSPGIYVRQYLKLLVISLLLLSASVFGNETLNKNRNHWFARNLLLEDPGLGFLLGDMSSLNTVPKRIDQNDIDMTLSKDAPNVILIICDALRADYMSIYGHADLTTPLLEKMRSRSVNFNQASLATSGCTSSLCSIMAILFGHNHADLPFNKKGIHDYLSSHDYQVSFVLSGMHKDFYNLKDQYGPNIHFYFESDAQMVDSLNLPFYDDNSLVNYLSGNPGIFDRSKKHFIYFHLMAPHILSRKTKKTNSTIRLTFSQPGI